MIMVAAAIMMLTATANAKGNNANRESDSNVIIVNYEDAKFPGGEDACAKWIESRLRVPSGCLEQGIGGEVTISFVVEADGEIGDVRVLNATNDDMADEAVRVVRQMPAWQPGTANGIPVRVRYTQPVRFEIK